MTINIPIETYLRLLKSLEILEKIVADNDLAPYLTEAKKVINELKQT